MGFWGLPTHPPPSSNEVKKRFFLIVYVRFTRFHAYFCEGGGEAPALASIRKSSKNNATSNILNKLLYLVFRVRDSSEKPATGVACEDLQRIARPEAEGRKPYLRRDTPRLKM
jgi:hypothetical protein